MRTRIWLGALAALLLVGSGFARAADLKVEGYASFASLAGEASKITYFSYRGSDPGFIERSTTGEDAYTWRTAIVPALKGRTDTVTFAFGVCTTGPEKMPQGEHEFLLNGAHLITISLPVNGDATWREGEVTLRFDFTTADAYDDLEGVMYLTVPAARVTPGKDVELTARGRRSESRDFLILSAIPDVLTDPAARPANNPSVFVRPAPMTAAQMQYDGTGQYQVFKRLGIIQGLDTLLGRGRVEPEALFVRTDDRGEWRQAQRTIFRDEFTHAEVWRLTDSTQGVVRHDYSAYPAWNANGRWLKLSWSNGMPMFLSQETNMLWQTRPLLSGQWSTTEPDILFGGGEWKGKNAIVAYDLKTRQAVRGLGPVRQYAGIAPVSADGKYVCWREGIQDDATTFGLAAADGSSYQSISLNGGIVTNQTPPTFEMPGPQPSVKETTGGVHQMYFTRRPDHSIHVGSNCYDPRAFLDRFYLPDGTYFYHQDAAMSHVSWHPRGEYAICMGLNGIAGWDLKGKRLWPILDVRSVMEGHTTWTSYDPNWAAASLRTDFAGEIVRISMRPDHSVARLAGSCPINPGTTAYDNDEFASLSPDGTKVLFMSTMSGSVNEYVVVAANPRAPALSGKWTKGGYVLTWKPDALSREIRGYRVYRSRTAMEAARPISGVVAGTSYRVEGLRPTDPAFFTVRAQEWSGLLSRHSNQVSSRRDQTANYVEAESLDFTGFKQGFDPEGAGDMYYLFIPLSGSGRVTLRNPQARRMFIRVRGMGCTFAVTHPLQKYGNKSTAYRAPGRGQWAWVDLGRPEKEIILTSTATGFAFDRIAYAPDGSPYPPGIGSDYAPDARFQASLPAGVQAKAETPFAVRVSWKPVPGARYYSLYAADRADFTPAQANLLYSPAAGSESVIDWGVHPGTTYSYRVVAVDHDGTSSRPSPAVSITTPAMEVHAANLEYESGATDAAALQQDEKASGGRFVKLDKGVKYELRFAVPAEGDYVVWHRYRGESGAEIAGTITLDGAAEPWREHYDQAALYGQATSADWVWHRYRFAWGPRAQGIVHLTPGEHTLALEVNQPIHLDRLVITNDLSYVPDGKLCTF